ncbi:MAG: hypothetical protein GX844_09080, partial [Alcaligenaceae bacterium]|nr:hypothetical protein [Alcaligenaceae bacterium]
MLKQTQLAATDVNPLLPKITQQLSTLDPKQLAWISGYSWALSQANGINGTHDVSTNGVEPSSA